MSLFQLNTGHVPSGQQVGLQALYVAHIVYKREDEASVALPLYLYEHYGSSEHLQEIDLAHAL